jgi:hypothetical protein
MTREQKVWLANQLSKMFALDLFDEEGTIEEDQIDLVVSLVDQAKAKQL